MNSYHIIDTEYSLEIIQTRLAATDLVPSRSVLLENIEAQFKLLCDQGILTLADLRYVLKNNKRLEGIAARTGINADYLVLLRREIESWFPKPCALRDFDWLPWEEIDKLEASGIKDSAVLFEKTTKTGRNEDVSNSTSIDQKVLIELVKLADLTRVQWVSAKTAGMLLAAGYSSPEALAHGSGEDLCADLARVNEDGKYYKGTIGLRDCKRLIQAAGYVPA